MDHHISYGERRPNAPDVILSLHGVGVQVGGGWLFRDVSFRAIGGEFVQVSGGNGSGKTTLLKTAARLVRPRPGRVEVSGRLAWQPDHLDGPPRMKAGAYLAHVARIHRVPTSEVGALVRTTAARLQLEPHLGKSLRNLSRGMLKRFSLAQTLVSSPDIALLDEPWAHVDPAGHLLIDSCIEELLQAGCLVMVAVPQTTTNERLPAARRLHLSG